MKMWLPCCDWSQIASAFKETHILCHWFLLSLLVCQASFSKTFNSMCANKHLQLNSPAHFSDIVIGEFVSTIYSELPLLHFMEPPGKDQNIMGIIGDLPSQNTIQMANILNAYKIPQKFTSLSFNGSLSFALHTNRVPGFQEFLENLNPYHSK
ncbi:hypothetical protein E2320_003366, partial [Naja naja]